MSKDSRIRKFNPEAFYGKKQKHEFESLSENIIGFHEIVTLLSKNSSTKDELFVEFMRSLVPYGIEWKTTAQMNWRLNWLRSMKFVVFKKSQYSLTNEGRELILSTGDKIEVFEPIVENITLGPRKKEISRMM